MILLPVKKLKNRISNVLLQEEQKKLSGKVGNYQLWLFSNYQKDE